MRRLPEMDTEIYLKFWELEQNKKYKISTLVPIDPDDTITSLDISKDSQQTDYYAITTRQKGSFQLWQRKKDVGEWHCKSSGRTFHQLLHSTIKVITKS